MLDLDILMNRSQHSGIYRWWLNQILSQLIPFNKPHGINVLEVSDHDIKTLLPYRRKNLNHIKGLHAMALATLSEFTTGLLLLRILGTKKYRIILQDIKIQYHYQGKMNATAKFGMNQQQIIEQIKKPLTQVNSIVVPCKINTYDLEENQLTSATINWQLKSWEQVKTIV